MDSSFEDAEFTTTAFDFFPLPAWEESVTNELAMVGQLDQAFSNPCESVIGVAFDVTTIPDSINDGTVHRLTTRPFRVSNGSTIQNTDERVGMRPRFPIYNK
jgi:hypothetical protein